MWYYGIRLVVIVLTVFLFVPWVRKKKNFQRKRVILISLLGIMILMFISLPVENLFVTFSSPQAVFEYSHKPDNIMAIPAKIGAVVEGKDSAMILYSNSGTYSQEIYLKTENGWKISLNSSFNYEKVFYQFHNKYLIEIFKAKNTDDYYITIWDGFTPGLIEVTDNRNSAFCYTQDRVEINDSYTIQYYAYIQDLGEDYELTVDGETIYPLR